MVFTTHFFLFYFLPATLLFYYLLPRAGKSLFLTLVSYVFYGWANPKWVLLLLFSTAVDFGCGLWIENLRHSSKGKGLLIKNAKPNTAKWALIVSLVSNLGLLGIFKYFDFLAMSFNQMALAFGSDHELLELLHFSLPVGISFYTFQSMSYTIDIYRGQARALRNPLQFACYVALFPQLVAGPIVRYKDLACQLLERTHTLEKFATGILWFCLGFSKKILLANPMGFLADTCFQAGFLTTVDAWLGLFAYAFQIYFDFSGYSDMAIGLGLMLGFTFPINFNSPYHATSITDFWRRWHISLSTWLRDYLYIPLGGNRKGKHRTYLNLAIVMLLGGLWHGASWNFVIWGALHGCWLALERAFKHHTLLQKEPRWLKLARTFFLVCLAWVFFRAETLTHALAYLRMLFGLQDLPTNAMLISHTMQHPLSLAALGLAGIIIWRCPNTHALTQTSHKKVVILAMGAMVVAVAVMWIQAANPFLYFQF